MIIIRIELWSARNMKVTQLGCMVIANDATSENRSRGNYDAFIARKGGNYETAIRRPQRKGRVENFPRNSYSIWRLVLRCLRSAFPEEK